MSYWQSPSSFDNAAKLLNITQPALTRRIKKMEVDLHIHVFERTTRKVTLAKSREKGCSGGAGIDKEIG
ncbi:LysR family transcriptional regulator [Escherichia coli]